ncbi:MAG: alanine racemase [Patescibacteria group bacterium]
MKKLLTWASKRRFPYEPLITVEISKSRLLHNLDEFRKLAPNRSIAPVLKSNAYGHGLFEIADMLKDQSGIPFFVVDSYFEAVALRAHGIKTPLLIIGYTRPEMIMHSKLKKVSFTITNFETLKAISSTKNESSIHLKIDTGMRRQGILPEEIDEAIRLIKANSKIHLDGICSHLSDADSSNQFFTRNQILKWNKIVDKFKTQFPQLHHIHLSNTDGHVFNSEIIATSSRLGLGLYGIIDNNGLEQSITPEPVLEMKTILTGIKKLRKGETIGYGNTFTATADMTVATIPVGYYEGVDRHLSNKGHMLVGEQRISCPIVGRVSMNITTIDVSKVDARIGTPVIVISNNISDPNSIPAIAKISGDSIPYEMAVKIPPHLKRVMVK